ncbi:MAG TPA: ABC transporter ATP-binding protein [Burkholderiales bacterium]|nr:ABC transporter ATP-binding protein [Burkholderiales bacterium]
MRLIFCIAGLAVAQLVIAAEAPAPDPAATGNIVMIQASPNVIHYHSSPEHADWSWMVGIEWQRPSDWLLGFTYFNNSYNQKCQYYYVGYVWKLSDRDPNWYLKLTGGLVHGYKDPYEDKVPLNHNGYSPGVIPALGYKWNRWSAQVNVLGAAGFTLSVGFDLTR